MRIAGEKRYRIWSIYLAGCAFGFARNWMNIFQVLAVKAGRPNPLPTTRDWLYAPDDRPGPAPPSAASFERTTTDVCTASKSIP